MTTLSNCPLCNPGVPLPGDPEMEKCVVSCIMQAPEATMDAALTLLRPDNFSSEACGLLFDIVTRRHTAGELTDPVSLTGYFYDKDLIGKIGGPGFIAECYTASPNPAHVRHYAAQVLALSKRRQMVRIASDLARAAVLPCPDSDDWRDGVLPLLRKADAIVMNSNASDLITLKEVAFRYVDSGIENELDPPVAIGINRLDRMMEGGVRREYWLIGGRQGHGKSLLAMQIAGKLANAGRRGLVIGYDMTALQVLMRDIARETRVPLSHVMGRVPFEGMEVQQVTRGVSRLVEGWDVHYTESPYVTLEAIGSYARALHRHKALDFLVVDYLQSVPMKRAGKERSDEMLIHISGQIEKLRKEIGCTLIAPVQLNDEGLIRDARGILDAPQVFIRIEMEEITNEAGENETGDNGFLKCLKNRFGKPNFSVPVYRNGAYQQFEDREPDRTERHQRNTRQPNRTPYRH